MIEHHTALHLEGAEPHGCGCRQEMVPARGVYKAVHVGIHVVPLHVIRARDVPPSREVHQMGGGQIQFLLAVHIVYHHHRGVLVHILGQIVGILGHQPYMIARGEVLLQTALQKGIVVPDALTPAPHVVDNGRLLFFASPLLRSRTAKKPSYNSVGRTSSAPSMRVARMSPFCRTAVVSYTISSVITALRR